MPDESPTIDVEKKARAGHYEILGETYAKFEFFENGWNSYSRFLDVDKVDLILRRVVKGERIYREVQVKFGKLHKVGTAWEKTLFDFTSWRFFKEDEFAGQLNRPDFFVAYLLAADIGYSRDIFIFPIRDFVALVKSGIPSKGQRKIYISHVPDGNRWILRKTSKLTTLDDSSCVDVTSYRRNFALLNSAVS
jgi:hypothetical protein